LAVFQWIILYGNARDRLNNNRLTYHIDNVKFVQLLFSG